MNNKRLNDALFSGLAQALRFIIGPVTLLLLPLYVTVEDQGIWYTFLGLAALSTFADLGFTNIITMFSAHEISKLSFDENKKLTGDTINISRLSSIFSFILNWTFKIGTIAFCTMFVVGFVLFQSKLIGNSWQLPWIIFIFASFILYLANSFLVFVEGCNLVADVQKLRISHGIVSAILFLIALLSGMSILGLTIAMIISATFLLAICLLKFKSLFIQLVKSPKIDVKDIRSEFYNLFWKYAASFSSGYFIYQIYTPLVFAIYGPQLAGQVGFSLTLWIAVFTLSNIWMQSSYPQFNIYVAQKEWSLLDKRFKSSFILSLITLATASLLFILIRAYFEQLEIFKRMLPLSTQLLLIFGWFLVLISSSISLYVRSHKIEPFALPTFIQAIISSIITFYSIHYLETKFIFLGFTVSFLILLPWYYKIFIKNKQTHLMK
jgi:O-antigen/teichoic acid export membrane protein